MDQFYDWVIIFRLTCRRADGDTADKAAFAPQSKIALGNNLSVGRRP